MSRCFIIKKGGKLLFKPARRFILIKQHPTRSTLIDSLVVTAICVYCLARAIVAVNESLEGS